METLIPIAARVGELLKARKETIAVVESSSGGLLAAALLSVPGASAYFMGGAVSYTYTAREALLGLGKADVEGMRSASEPYAALLAARSRERLGTVWGLAETGAAGPTGNRYGDAAGHCVIALAGPVMRTLTIETGNADRVENMRVFAAKALETLEEALRA
jgi:nicotinamide-nucleotide amidase